MGSRRQPSRKHASKQHTNYGMTPPKADWATVWEAALSDDPEDRVGIEDNVALANEFLRRI